MNENSTQPTRQTGSPWKKAMREARGVILASIFVAVGFNLFASTGVSWIRELPTLPGTSDSTLFGDDDSVTQSVVNPATPVPAIDTTATGPSVDTAAAEAEAEKKRIADSIAAAKKAIADSLKNLKALADETAKSTEAGVVQGAVSEITSDQAKALFDKKRGFWIDARPAVNFAEGHIPGAINIYPDQLSKRINELPVNNMNTLIVIYCNGGLCELSHELANSISGIGFKRVVVYAGGIEEWTARKYPVTK